MHISVDLQSLRRMLTRKSPSPAVLKETWYSLIRRQEFSVFLLLMIIGIFLSLQTSTFLTPGNLFNVSRNFSWIAIAAFGESLVIIIGGIDLSVGAVMALSGLITALCLQSGLAMPWAVLAGLLTGGLVGWINGMLVGRGRLPAFVVTLGTMSIVRGVTSGLAGGWPVRNLPESFRFLGQADVQVGPWQIPMPVLVMLLLAWLTALLLNRTVLGRYLFTLGGSERALLVTGIDPTRIKIVVYTLCSILAATGGLLMTARLGVAAPTAATGYELDIVASAVIGGTSLFGGAGSILGVLLGAAFIQFLRNGLVLMGFPAYWQSAALGALILIALIIDHWRRQRDMV